ncbi:MAG: diguanylate cyclase domain-containing protein, partial [Oscillospiraceae bacterium]
MIFSKCGEIDYENLYMMQDTLDGCTESYVYIWDIKKDIFRISKSFINKFPLKKYVVTDIIKDWISLTHPEDVANFKKSVEGIIAGTETRHDLEYRIKDNNDEFIWVRCVGNLLETDNGDKALIGTISNITVKNKFDEITGLMVRRHFQNTTKKLLEKGNEGFLMVLGIDHFKGINEKYGEKFGDIVLREISK